MNESPPAKFTLPFTDQELKDNFIDWYWFYFEGYFNTTKKDVVESHQHAAVLIFKERWQNVGQLPTISEESFKSLDEIKNYKTKFKPTLAPLIDKNFAKIKEERTKFWESHWNNYKQLSEQYPKMSAYDKHLRIISALPENEGKKPEEAFLNRLKKMVETAERYKKDAQDYQKIIMFLLDIPPFPPSLFDQAIQKIVDNAKFMNVSTSFKPPASLKATHDQKVSSGGNINFLSSVSIPVLKSLVAKNNYIFEENSKNAKGDDCAKIWLGEKDKSTAIEVYPDQMSVFVKLEADGKVSQAAENALHNMADCLMASITADIEQRAKSGKPYTEAEIIKLKTMWAEGDKVFVAILKKRYVEKGFLFTENKPKITATTNASKIEKKDDATTLNVHRKGMST